METKFNFNSAICTSLEQSRRLLELGLKKETADMYWWQETNEYQELNGRWHCQLLSKYTKEHFDYLDKTFGVDLDGDIDDGAFIPTWSLHRLIEMMPKIIEYHDFVLYHTCAAYINNDYHIKAGFNGEPFSACIDCIEWLIKEGYFNKEYLV